MNADGPKEKETNTGESVDPLINFWIPTTGEPKAGLAKTVESIMRQTYTNVKITIGTDSETGHKNAAEVLGQLKPKNYIHFKFPERVTDKDQNGRPERLTSAAMFALKYDLWQPIGTGDWFEPYHAKKVLETFNEKKCQWVFSLRSIWDQHGKFICEDNFESIGFYPVWNTKDYYLIAGDSFCLPQTMAISVAHFLTLSRELGQRTDKFIFDNMLRLFPKLSCTNTYTYHWQLNRGTPEQLNFAKQWYLRGQQYMREKFPEGNYPFYKGEFVKK